MRIGTKILIEAVAAVALTSTLAILVQRSVIRNQGVDMWRNTLRISIREAESIRQSISRLHEKHAFDRDRMIREALGQQQISNTALYGTIPVVAAIQAVRQISGQEGFEFRVAKDHARNPENTPTQSERPILDHLYAGNDEYFAVDSGANQLILAKPIILSQDCLWCHGDPKESPSGNGKDILGFTMEDWKDGEMHGAFILKVDLERVDRTVRASIWKTILWIVPVAFGVGIAFHFLSRRSIVRPLQDVMNRLDSAAKQNRSASGQIADSSQMLAKAATQQAAAIEQTNASLKDISSNAQQNAATADHVRTIANQAAQAAHNGNAVMEEMSTAIDTITRTTNEVTSVVNTISGIALQTNLLALNAAIEAAHAGEAGRGFLIVAEQVRQLATHASDSARQTGQLIERAQDSAQAGVRIVGKMGDVLHTLNGTSDQVHELIAKIVDASQEQSASISNISTSIMEVDKIVQSNAATSEQCASASEQLSAQVAETTGAVESLAELVGSKAEAGT